MPSTVSDILATSSCVIALAIIYTQANFNWSCKCQRSIPAIPADDQVQHKGMTGTTIPGAVLVICH